LVMGLKNFKLSRVYISPREIRGPLSLKITMESEQYINASWRRLEGSYRTAFSVNSDLVGVEVQELGSLEKPSLEVRVLSPGDFSNLHMVRDRVMGEFRLSEDLEAVYEVLGRDPVARKLTHQYRGLRLVKYPNPDECLLVYQLSTNTTIARLDTMVNCLKARYGFPVRFTDGTTMYTYPKIPRLAGEPVDRLGGCKLGYKARPLSRLAKTLRRKPLDWGKLGGLDVHHARRMLKGLPGVGDKVADAVLLYAAGKTETLPVDIWVRRAVIQLYGVNPRLTYKQIQSFLMDRFGKPVGYFEPYLYYYAKTHKAQLRHVAKI